MSRARTKHRRLSRYNILDSESSLLTSLSHVAVADLLNTVSEGSKRKIEQTDVPEEHEPPSKCKATIHRHGRNPKIVQELEAIMEGCCH